MTEKDLKKLNRKQLLELLLKQTERADMLQDKLDEAEKKLLDKTIAETEAGSMAEAALKLNGVFQAADAACAQYLKNIENLCKNQNLLIERREAKSKKMADELLKKTEALCSEREAAAKENVERLELKAKELQSQIDLLEKKAVT